MGFKLFKCSRTSPRDTNRRILVAKIRILFVHVFVSVIHTVTHDVVMQFISLSSSQEIQRLNLHLREKELELESVRCQPDHEKDQEIQRLRSALEEKERSEATRAVLCTSLAEEADQLRSHLGATVKVCQELLARLEKGKKGAEEAEVVSQQQNAKEVCDARAVFTVFVHFGLH